MLIYMVFIVDVFKLIEYPIAGDSSAVICIWVAGFGYSIARYRLLSVTPEYISNELLSYIDESVILVNSEKKVIMLNKRAQEILKVKGPGNVTQFSANIPEFTMIDKKANALLRGEGENFSCRASYIDDSSRVRNFNSRFSLVRDAFGDVLGVLIIARESRELMQLKKIHNITDRQMSIITMALAGLSNRDLAEQLNISEKTVENHMINIYNKLGVSNKIELYNLVQQYGFGGNKA